MPTTYRHNAQSEQLITNTGKRQKLNAITLIFFNFKESFD